MTVAELIAELQKLPQHLPVFHACVEWGVEEVKHVPIAYTFPKNIDRGGVDGTVCLLRETDWFSNEKPVTQPQSVTSTAASY